MSGKIHASAVIHDGAKIGADVEIGPFCEIGPHVKIGDGVRLHGRVSIMGNTDVGDGCELFPGVILGGRAQSIGSEDDPQNRLVIGARCVLREGVTANVGSNGHGELTEVGADAYIMAYAHIAHDCRLGERCVIANNVAFAGHCIVGDQVWIGGLAAIHQFSHIGDHAFIGGGSILVGDLVPFGIATGNPAMLSGVNVNGLKRRGFSRADMAEIRRCYKALFEGSGEFANRLENVRARVEPGSHAEAVIRFIDRSERSRRLTFPGRT